MGKNIEFVIKGRPITKKNHQSIVYNSTTKRRMVVPSKEYKSYEQNALWQLPHPEKPIDFKINVKCLYYMPTKHRVDLVNLLEATDDILTSAGIIEDDNSNIIGSHDGSRVLYDKDDPRVEIIISVFQD